MKYNSVISVLNNTDLISQIIKNNKYNINDYLQLKKINKSFNKTIKLYIKKKLPKENKIYSARTFININECMVCGKNGNKMCNLIYYQDICPKRIIVHCKDYQCYLDASKYYLDESIEFQKLIVLNNPLNIEDNLFIPRSNGDKTLAEIDKHFIAIIQNKIYFKFSFKVKSDIFHKCCQFNDLYKVNTGKYLKSLDNLKNDILNDKIKFNPFYDHKNCDLINKLFKNLKNDIILYNKDI